MINMCKDKEVKQPTEIERLESVLKSILGTFEREIVEVLFPELVSEIKWELGYENLDNGLLDIQNEISDKQDTYKPIADKMLKVRLKDNRSVILFIHVEAQSNSSEYEALGERMFRYFYKIFEKFRYEYGDDSTIVSGAIYTRIGERDSDNINNYNGNNALAYNFKTIDVNNINIESVSEDNPLRLVFRIVKSLLETKATDKAVNETKMKLLEEVANYDRFRDDKQIRALEGFLERF